MNSKKRGLMIVFEGLDRCGKSTQAKKLKSFFESKSQNAEIIGFPDRTTDCGKILDAYLKNSKNLKGRAQHLLFSFNRWEKAEEIKSWLEKGINVIIDRYAFSGVAYSVAKGESIDWCFMPDQGLPRPDIVFQLDTDTNNIKVRANFGEERHDNVDFLVKVRTAYENFHKFPYWTLIDASQGVEEIHSQISQKIELLIKKYESNDIAEVEKNYFPVKIGEDLFNKI
jgi:dTMP kinase